MFILEGLGAGAADGGAYFADCDSLFISIADVLGATGAAGVGATGAGGAELNDAAGAG